MPSTSPLPYTGNKSCIIDTILSVMPTHTVYIEPCMGSAEVFLRKKPAEREIINDYNGDLVNFFRVLQNNRRLVVLLGSLTLSLNAEQIFQYNRELLERTPNILDDLRETGELVSKASDEEIAQAVAFFENQVYSFSSTGQSYGIARRDITHRIPRLISACQRLRGASILHRDYKDAIRYGAGPGAFILLDPPYRGTEDYYRKSQFDESQHEVLFAFMARLHTEYGGACKFLITYNNDPAIQDLAARYGFDTFVQSRLHSMRQSKEGGAQFEELLIANYDLLKQAEENCALLPEPSRQLTLFDYNCDYMKE